MRANDFLTEIDYTPGADELVIDDDSIINKSNIVGKVDQTNVYLYTHSDVQQIYFFLDNVTITAYIVVQHGQLRGMRNRTGIYGSITALIGYVVHNVSPLMIAATEPFTPAGFNWLKSFMLAKGRGITITDQNGNYPDIVELEKEWKTAMIGNAGNTSIKLEGTERYRNFTVVTEGRLSPVTFWIGDNRL